MDASSAVSHSYLVAFVPRRLAESLAKPFSLAALPPPIDPGEYQEGLYYPLRAAQDPASIWLRKLVLEAGQQIDHHERPRVTA